MLAQPHRHGRVLSKRTVLHHHRVLRTALQAAVRWQLIPRNPADGVKPPKPERHEVTALDEAQTAKLLKAAQGTSFYVPLVLGVTAGMRRGEVLGLTWQNVSLSDGCLHVTQALGSVSSGTFLQPPKTAKGVRRIALLPFAVEVLKAHRKQQAEERLSLGARWIDNDLVCPAEDGTLWRPNCFTQAWVRFAKQSGVPCNFHALRHTHASQLLRQGVHPKIVSERLGHSSVGLTLDTYSHLLPGMQEDAAAQLDGVLRRALANVENA